jgi:PAS domain S-box-containing protein
MHVRVLLVESQAGAEVVLAELQRADHVLTSQRVETEADLRRSLVGSEWDLIIADHVLPALSAVAALSVVQEQDPDLPFLVIAARIGEAAAVDLMRAGAHDVIDQDNLRRLRPAVERELREAVRRRQHRTSDAALRGSEERYRMLVESSPEAIAVHSQGVVVYANPAAARLMAAADVSELLGKPVLDFVHPDDRPIVLERIRRTQEENRLAEPIQERFVRLDGAILHVETVALPTRFEGHVATQVVVRDITAHTRAAAAQRFLAQASARLSSSLEYRETLRTVAQLAVPDLGDWCLVDLLEPDGSFERVAVAGQEVAVQEAAGQEADDGAGPAAPDPASRALGQVASSRTTCVVNDATREGEPTTRVRSYVCAPLVARGRLLGAITFCSFYPHRYDGETVGVAEELASRSALAIDNAGLFERAQSELAVRARAEAELTASRNQLEVILGGIADGVIVQESNGRFVYANEAAARLAGFDSVGDYLNATAAEISERLEVVDVRGQAFDYDQLPARRALRGEDAPEMVVQYRRRDTWETRWSLTRARLVHAADGRPLAISIFHDLTDRIRAEQRLAFLAEAGARLGMSLDERETLEAVTQLAVQRMADWAVVYVPDERSERLLRTAFAHRADARRDLILELEERYPARPGPESVLWRVLQGANPVLTHDLSDAALMRAARDEDHLRILRALRLVSAIYVPLEARGRTLGVLALFTAAESGRRLGAEDLAVTEEIARRLSLAVDNARLYMQTRDAIRARDEFLSLASHELRNPVAAISGTAQLIERARQRNQLDDRLIDRYMSVIQRTSAHLANLTEDLLDVGRLQEGRLPLRFRDMDLADLVRGIAAREQSRSEGARITLSLACDPCRIVADADRLEQVITNLLDNARKYSPREESIEVQLSSAGDGVLLAVCDQGIGLPAGSAERIFEPFGRARNATERNIPGLGLGLYISRQIVERHGGRLWAESGGEGRGTTFRLWLPTLATR